MERQIVVVGGGIAGLGAALELGRQGLPVTLVEAAENNGGFGARWACMATHRCERCGACLVHDALAEAEHSRAFTWLPGRRISAADHTGADLRLVATRESSDPIELNGVEGVVLATGFQPHDLAVGRPVGAAGHPAVLSTLELNDALRSHRLEALPFGDRPRARLAVLHCVGSRDPAAGRGYCSQICCGTAIRAARRLKYLRPGWEITLFYNDLQIFGKEARLTDLSALRLIQGIPAEIRPPWPHPIPSGAVPASGEDGAARDKLSPGPASLELVFQAADGQARVEGFDGVLLVPGLSPRPGTAPLAAALGLGTGPHGFVSAAGGEDRRVVAAGACLGPMGIEASLLSGRAAAARLAEVISPRRRPWRGSTALRHAAPGVSGADAPQAHPGEPGRAARQTSPSTTVAVVGHGAQAEALLSSLSHAGLEAVWIQPAPARGAAAAPAPPGAPPPRDVREVGPLSGALGDFSLTLLTAAGREDLRCGAVVLCDDLPWETPVSIKDGPPSRVVDHLDLEPNDVAGGPAELVLWLDPAGPPSRAVAARLLSDVAEAQADGRAAVTLLCRHVPLPGLEAQGHYDRARRAGMRVVRTVVDQLPRAAQQDDAWALTIADALAPELPVLLPLRQLLEAARPQPPSRLAAGLGLGLDAEGFAPRANVRLAPLRTERAGLYVVGDLRQEALPTELASQREALAAELLALLGEAADLLPTPAVEIDPGRCAQCLTCVRVCPHLAAQAEPRGAPRIWATACEGCGRCIVHCPSGAIRARGSAPLPPRATLRHLPDLAPGTSRVDVPPVSGPTWIAEGDPVHPGQTVAFACRHAGAPALRAALADGAWEGLRKGEDLRAREVPCLSAVGDLDVLSALRAGASRVLFLGCHPGSCRHVDGDARCAQRVALLRGRLADLGAPQDRVIPLALSPAEPARLAQALRGLLPHGEEP